MQHLRSLERDEQGLIMDQRSVIPVAQLVYPVRAPYQDQDDCRRQKHHEYLEACWQWGLALLNPSGSPLRSYVADCEFYSESYEDGDCKDLERETRDGDVDCNFTAS